MAPIPAECNSVDRVKNIIVVVVIIAITINGLLGEKQSMTTEIIHTLRG